MSRHYIPRHPQTGHATSDPDQGDVVLCDVCEEVLYENDVRQHPSAPGEDFCPSCYDAQDWNDWTETEEDTASKAGRILGSLIVLAAFVYFTVTMFIPLFLLWIGVAE